MKWEETVAFQCRWSEVVIEVLGANLDIVWECSESGYQGSANIVAIDHINNTVIHYEWTYGSCSGCDTWESLEDAVVRDEIGKTVIRLVDRDTVKAYFQQYSPFDVQSYKHISPSEILEALEKAGYFKQSISELNTGKGRFTDL